MSTHGRNLDPDDFFADTRMSFGDHIEDLRSHLIRAFLGFCVALGISLFFGSYVLEFISYPIEKELASYYDRRLEKRKAEMLAKIGDSPEPQRAVLHIPREELEKIFGLPVKSGPWLVEDGKLVALTTVTNARQKIEDWSQLYQELGPRPGLKSFTIMETVLVWFKVCIITGLVIGSPWLFYQIWSFIAAGLYPQEKKLVNHYLPFSILLFLGGVSLCQFVVMPQTISALLAFNEWLGIEPELRLNDWLNFALLMPLLFGLSFQTPLAMLTLERVGLMTVEGYRSKRSIILFLLAVAYVIVSPTPDPWTMILFWVPMAGLYELGIWLCKLAPGKPLLDLSMSESEEMVEV
jgi:sec-independent protein translocase protein TatC